MRAEFPTPGEITAWISFAYFTFFLTAVVLAFGIRSAIKSQGWFRIGACGQVLLFCVLSVLAEIGFFAAA